MKSPEEWAEWFWKRVESDCLSTEMTPEQLSALVLRTIVAVNAEARDAALEEAAVCAETVMVDVLKQVSLTSANPEIATRIRALKEKK